MPIQRLNPDTMPRRLGLNHVVQAGDWVWIASQASLDSDANLIGPGDPDAQTARIYGDLENGVKAVGGTLHDIVSTTHLISAREYHRVVERAGERLLGPKPPANTTIVLPIQSFPGLLDGAFATAVVGEGAKSRECINPPGVPTPQGYSHVVKVDNVVYISGQFAYDKDGQLVGKAAPDTQAKRVYENLDTCLRAAGASRGDVVKTSIFYTHPHYYDVVCHATEDFYGANPPAGSAAITLLADPDALLEIEAIAVIGGEKQRLNPDTLAKPRAFSTMVRAGKMVCISGQFGLDRTGALIGKGDADAQLEQAYKNLTIALKTVGAGPTNVVRAPMFYLRPEFYGSIIKRRQDFWGTDLPTPPSMPVLGLPDPGWLVGVEAVAILD